MYWKASTNIRCIRIRRQDTLGCWEVRTWAKGEDGEIICGEARTRSGIEYFPRDFFHRPGQNKREKWGGGGEAARKRSACGITMPWFIDSSRPTDDALSVYPAVHGICGLAISWFAFYGLIGIRSRTKHAQKSPFQLRLCFCSEFVRKKKKKVKASFDFCPIILRLHDLLLI